MPLSTTCLTFRPQSVVMVVYGGMNIVDCVLALANIAREGLTNPSEQESRDAKLLQSHDRNRLLPSWVPLDKDATSSCKT